MANNWKKTPRGAALRILEMVFNDEAYSNIALNKVLKNSDFQEQDKGMITEIVYGTISRKLTLEWYLSHYVKDREKIEKWVYDLLLLSLYQIIYLEKIPDHAVVNEAVAIAKNRGNKKGAEKFINAVLRQFLEKPRPDIASVKRQYKRLSLYYSTPVWLIKKLKEDYGDDRALAILESLFEKSKASIRVIQLSQKETIREELDLEDSVLTETALVSQSGHFAQSSFFKDGEITIQDESSQLVATYLNPKSDDQILDACSAPGGKTVHIASYLDKGKITALDLYPHKLALVNENSKRLKVDDKIVTQELDAQEVHKHFAAETFDKILVDAPCSGIGLIRRKPDIKYNKALKDLTNLQKIQINILSSVCQTLKKGGIITYSTCTIFREENQEVIRQFLEQHSNFVQVQLNHPKENIIKDGCVVITPELYKTDGFFIAQMKRVF